MKKGDVDKEIQKAFNVWSEYTDLTFTPTPKGQVHIEIRFEKGEHGDGDPFDGPGGTLAHAYFPVSFEELLFSLIVFCCINKNIIFLFRFLEVMPISMHQNDGQLTPTEGQIFSK